MAYEKVGNIRGPQGEKGTNAGFGTPVISVDESVGTPSAEVLVSGPDTAKVFTFQFHNLKGETGAQGPQGVKGDTGAQGPQGVQGVKGDKGDPFTVAKTYASVAAMNSGFATDGVPIGGFVVIDTGDVEDEDNAKLYMKGESAYTYITDLSGAEGIQGPQGIQGIQGPKGDQGDQGPQGVQGPIGSTGPQGVRGSLWTSGPGAPSGSANVGDMYLDTATGDVYRMA